MLKSGRISRLIVEFCDRVQGVVAWQKSSLFFCNAKCRLLCRFLDAGNNETLRTLSGPASKKRQGTKSREIGHWLAASAMGISCWRRSRLWAGRPHNASCMSARTRGRESAVGISAGARSASTGDRRTGGCDGVERDRRGRGPSASERESRDAHKMSGS
jgi:hypothetical protein